MSMARLVITAVVVEGRTKSEVARDYDVSRYWVQQLVQRYPRRARPPSSRGPDGRTPARTRCGRGRGSDRSAAQGADQAGPGRRRGNHPPTWPSHPRSRDLGRSARLSAVPAVSTIWRILTRRGFVTPQPQKRPRSSWRSSAPSSPTNAGRPTSPTGGWPTAPRSRSSTFSTTTPGSPWPATPGGSSPAPTSCHLPDAFGRWGIPASVLTDNGAVFTGLHRRGGRVALEVELGRRGVRFGHSRPYHPQTCGKVERFHQTQKKWLPRSHRRRPPPGCNANSPGSAATTTRSDPTGPSAAAPPPRPTPPDPRPSPPAPTSPATGASATTASTLRHRHPAPQQPTAPHRPRPPPRRHPGHPAGRRPPHPGHRPPHRRAHPRTHPRPHPRLPAPRPPTRAPAPTSQPRRPQRRQGWPQATRRASALTAARTTPPSQPGCRTPPKCNDVPRHLLTVSRDITFVRPRQDSNLRHRLRRAVLYPLSYGGRHAPFGRAPGRG